MTQQLHFFEAAQQATNVKWLERTLDEYKGWLTAANLAVHSAGVLTDREIRILASASPLVLSGPGSPGYRHIKHATAEEIQRYSDAMISQGKAMVKRGIRIKRTAHMLVSGTASVFQTVNT